MNSYEFLLNSWNSWESLGILKEFLRISWEFLDFLGIPRNSYEFLGLHLRGRRRAAGSAGQRQRLGTAARRRRRLHMF